MIKKRTFPLAYKEDIVLSIETMKAINATRIWDIGCGNCAWAIKVNDSLNGDATFELLDNFTFVKEQNLELLPYWWPSDEEELIEHLDRNNLIYRFHNRHARYLPDTEADFIRLDADEEDENTIANCLFNLSENGVIQQCDIKTNKSLWKFMMMQDEVIKGNLELVWIGEAEAVWSRPGKSEELKSKLLNNKDLQIYFEQFHEKSYKLIGIEHKYVCAKLIKTITSRNKGL